jgi:hypothetical protein
MHFADSFHPYCFYAVCTYDGFMPGVGISTLCSLGWANSFFIFASNRVRVGIILPYGTFGSDFGKRCFYHDYIVFMSICVFSCSMKILPSLAQIDSACRLDSCFVLPMVGFAWYF